MEHSFQRRSVSTLNLALSTDANGHPYHATLIASILRRTSMPVHVRCWCRGFLPESFETGPLKVEFIAADEEVTGKFPSYVGPAVFDRLRVIQHSTDWDRCLIMDYDQLALCDLAPLFDMELGDHLLAAKMQGPGVNMAHAMREWIKRPFPAGWEHVADYPYFSMGPLLNLKAMRESGTWEKLLAAHAAFGVDEQLSLTAATDGRTIGFDRKWNLFPKSDIHGDEVPEGVIHWLGWPKPWHKGAKVWRPDIWLSEEVSWEHLRMGIWRKPVAIEVEPEDFQSVQALARRGWKVLRIADCGLGIADSIGEKFPDLRTIGETAVDFRRALAEEEVDSVRLGPWVEAADWLEGCETLPAYLVLRGELEAWEVDQVRELGYSKESRLITREWPAGGPLPRALDYVDGVLGSGVKAGEELYLKRDDGTKQGLPSRTLKRRGQRLPVPEPKKIGVAIIATANYRVFAGPLIRSIRRNFLPGHEVTVFLFTDGDYAPAPGLKVIQVEHSAWPGMAIRRYPIFREHEAEFGEMDYLYYLDADMRVTMQVGDEILGDLVGVIHPGFHDKTRQQFTYESRSESTAFISPNEGSHYFCGACQGGTTAEYLKAVRHMAEKIDEDERNGIVARWHDESHWNRYLIDHPPSLILSPSYCCYPDGRSADFEPRISVVLKDAKLMRK